MTGTERTGRAALPLAEAAGRMGLTPDALRMRIRRGKAKGFKRDGHVFVFVDDQPNRRARASGSSEQRSAPDRRTTEQARTASRASRGPELSIVVEFQKVELDRLLRENDRLNRRLDERAEEARQFREMLQREQILRQQEQRLQQQLQTVVARLSDGLALPVPAAGPEAREAGASPAAPPEVMPDAAREFEPDADASARRETGPSLDERAGETPARERAERARPRTRRAAPANAASDPKTEQLGELLKEIGQSLRELERDSDPPAGPGATAAPVPSGAAPVSGPGGVCELDRSALDEILGGMPIEEDRRKAARILTRLFRTRSDPRARQT